MSLIVKYDESQDSKADLLKADTYVGVCYAVVNIGKQLNKTFGKYTEKVAFLFELADTELEYNGETRRYVFSKDYTLSLAPKGNLRKMLTAWNHEDPLEGRKKTIERQVTNVKTGEITVEKFDVPETDYDLALQLGKVAMVTIGVYDKKDGTKGNCITAIGGAPSSVKCEPENELVEWDINDYRLTKQKADEGDSKATAHLFELNELAEKLPQWLVEKAKASGEPQEAIDNNANQGDVISFEGKTGEDFKKIVNNLSEVPF